VAGAVLVLKYDLGLAGVLAVNVLATAINFFFHYFFARQFQRIKLCFDMDVWREIIQRSWPLAITIVLNLVYLKADTLFLSLIPRPSALGIIAETGLYGAAYKIIDVVVALPFIFSGIVLPILTSRWLADNKESFNSILQKSFEILMIFAVPLAVGTQFLATDVMRLVAGNDFVAAGPILQILILAAGAIFLGNAFAHAIIAIDRQKKTIPAYLFTAVTSVIAYLFFIKKYSYFGAAWVTVYSEIFIAAASVYYVWKYARFKPSFRIILKTGAASSVMAAVIMAAHYAGIHDLLFVLPLAVAAYFIALYCFRGMLKEDIMILLNK
jgi:O-antigen/teichoic acid export membrane protein